MFHLARSLAVADTRRAPGRFLAVTILLVVAICLPWAIDAGPVLGFLLAVVVASAATAGAVSIEAERAATLATNGAAPLARAVMTAAPIALSGLVASAVAIAIGLGRGAPHPLAAIALGLVVPFGASVLITWVESPNERIGANRALVVTVLVVLLAPTVILPLALVAGLMIPRLDRAPRLARWAATAVAIGVTLGSAVVFGASGTFGDLGLTMVLAAVPLSLCVGWLGAATVAGVARVVAGSGPTGRLAAGPLAAKARQVGPIAAATALVVTLAAAEALVGPSFGAREAQRLPAEELGRAGSSDEQMIIPVAGAQPDATRSAAADAVAGRPVHAAVIERVDGGGTETLPGYGEDDFGFLDFRGLLLTPPETTVTAASGPTWVGVVTADDLTALGLDRYRRDLARGDALVLNPAVPTPGSRLTIGRRAQPEASVDVPAVSVRGAAALGLPAVLISEARADEAGGVRNAARVVLAPASGGGRSDVGQAAFRVPVADLPPVEVPGFELALGSHLGAGPWWGDQVLVGPTSPRLNAVPGLSGEREAGQERALALAVLALLVGLAGTLLLSSGGRNDDAVLLVQGAPGSFRVRVAAIRTGLVTFGATLSGLAIGLGVPFVAITYYNAGDRDPRLIDVPVEVSGLAVMIIVAMPVIAALLAAAITVTYRRASADTLAHAAMR